MPINVNTYLAKQYRLVAKAKLKNAHSARVEGDSETVSILVAQIKRDLRIARQYREKAAK